ncbi:MAG TPA: hypothetical protein PK559_02370 [Ignavibacteriaceae bacterium]|nr:hypothetical protein [Ignavibacteriaceae bacterium]
MPTQIVRHVADILEKLRKLEEGISSDSNIQPIESELNVELIQQTRNNILVKRAEFDEKLIAMKKVAKEYKDLISESNERLSNWFRLIKGVLGTRSLELSKYGLKPVKKRKTKSTPPPETPTNS